MPDHPLHHHSKVSQPELISGIRYPTQLGVHESTNRTDVVLLQVGFQQGTQLVERDSSVDPELVCPLALYWGFLVGVVFTVNLAHDFF